MIQDILLTSEDRVKEITAISDNVAGEYMTSAIREVQDFRLQRVVGTKLYAKLKTLVGDDTISLPANAAYKTLLDVAQYFLAYEVACSLMIKLNWKVTNAGVVTTPDDKVQPADMATLDQVRSDYRATADDYCDALQRHILANRANYPELDTNTCNEIQAHLRDSASCGLFLGGVRGRIVR